MESHIRQVEISSASVDYSVHWMMDGSLLGVLVRSALLVWIALVRNFGGHWWSRSDLKFSSAKLFKLKVAYW